MTQFAIAGASGTFKGVFVHGVLSAFERNGFLAAAYAGASSSTLSCSAAACGMAEEVGLDYWLGALETLRKTEGDLSRVVLESVRIYGPEFRKRLFAPGERRPRLLIAASRVNNDTAAAETQGPLAKRLGKRLLIDALRKNSQWPASNLDSVLFDTEAIEEALRLTEGNYDAVAYATTRMLHAWNLPAEVEGVPFVDASYTNACPADELWTLGYRRVLAISPVPGPVYKSIFQERMVGQEAAIDLHIITPEADPQKFGVDFNTATEDGLREVYRQGLIAGARFLDGLS